MTAKPLWKAPEIVPSLTYTDVPGAIAWLERVFGFRERAESRLSWEGGCLAWMEVGDGLFSLSPPDRHWPHDGGVPGSRTILKVYVEDVDRHFARARAEGATILMEPMDGFWGGRIYRALDHEGHAWEISQRGRDLTSDQWDLPPGVTRGAPR